MCFTGRLPIWRRQSPANGREIACFSRIRTRFPPRLGETKSMAGDWLAGITLPETNIAPENGWLEY